jgi:hypothetical protein
VPSENTPAGPQDRKEETSEPAPVPAQSLPARRSRRLRRSLKVAAGVLLGFAAIYLLAANLFLNLWFGVLFAGTNSINITLGRAWTLWPGDVHVRDVRVTFQDHNLQWSLDIARANVGLKLLPLVRQTFHATRVHGEGTVFRMRHRVDPWSVDEPAVAALPPIPEFRAPAVFESRVPEPPLTDEEYNLWTVHLEGVDVGVRETWVQQFRYVGNGRARGKFRLRAARSLWVGPASLELEPGRLTAAAFVVSPALSGRIDCTVHPFDVREPQGRAVFRYFTVGLALRAREIDLGVLRLFRPQDPTELRAAGGELRVDARTDHGVFKPGSRLEFEQRGLSVKHPRGAAEFERVLVVLSAKPASRGEALLELANVRFRFPEAQDPAVLVETLRATAASSSVDTSADWQLGDLELQEGRASVPDVRAFAGVLAPTDLRPLSGAVSGSGRASYRNRTLEGELRAGVERLRFASGKSELELDGKAFLSAAGASLETRSGSLLGKLEGGSLKISAESSSFEAGGVRLEARANAENGRGKGNVRVELSTLRARAGGMRFDTRGELVGTLEDWDLEQGTSRSSLGGKLTNLVFSMPEEKLRVRAERVDLRSLTRTTPKPSERASVPARLAFDASLSRVHFQQGTDEDEGLRGIAQKLDLRSHLESHANGSLDGALITRARGVEASYDRLRVQGSPELELKLENFQSAQNTGRVHADLTVNGFSINDPEGDADCPWSSVDVASVQADAVLRGKAGMNIALDAAMQRARLALGDFSTRFAKAELKSRFDSGPLDKTGGRIEVELGVHDARLASGGSEKAGWDASTPLLTVEAVLDRAPGGLSGPLRVNAENVKTRLGGTRFSTHASVDVSRSRIDFEQGHLTGAGTMQLRDLDLALKDERIEDWWADVSLTSLDLWTKENLEGVATFSAKLRDGLPALTVLASQGELPGFVPEIFPLRDLTARGTVRRHCRLTDFRVKEVAGGPFVANGRVQSEPEVVRGAFLVRLAAAAPIAAGVRFDADDSGVSLFSGEGWLKEQSAPLERAAKASEREICIPAPRTCGD